MVEQTPECCPYCKCTDIYKTKKKGLIEIGPVDFDEEEEFPVDIWICPECQRRFVVLDSIEDE